ncbi:hypothetical protein [Pseudodesulfovibrio sp.]|uniref:hypothetical protein n=1 Tax=unclassified Pseudodesulfovibrio TaxID=2661612 RepID=UPI003B0043F9
MNRCCKGVILAAGLLTCLAAAPALADDSFASATEAVRQCGVSGTLLDDLAARVTRGEVDQAVVEKLLVPLLEVCADKLPTSPLEDKLAEGLAKSVPPERIVPVLSRRAVLLVVARNLLLKERGEASKNAVSLLGEGLDSGVPKTDFLSYLKEFGKQPEADFLIGLAMVSYQGQVGFPVDLTLDIIRQGGAGKSLSEGWRYLVRIIIAARSRGVDDPTVARAAREALRNGEPVTGVVTRLGFTGRSLSGVSDNQ